MFYILILLIFQTSQLTDSTLNEEAQAQLKEILHKYHNERIETMKLENKVQDLKNEIIVLNSGKNELNSQINNKIKMVADLQKRNAELEDQMKKVSHCSLPSYSLRVVCLWSRVALPVISIK